MVFNLLFFLKLWSLIYHCHRRPRSPSTSEVRGDVTVWTPLDPVTMGPGTWRCGRGGGGGENRREATNGRWRCEAGAMRWRPCELEGDGPNSQRGTGMGSLVNT
ncbi:hypothetical protein SEVIR_2G446350v4 [Setaria viridis]